MEQGLDVDDDALDEGLRVLQRRLHPDRFATSTQEQRDLADAASARVNGATAVLRDDLRRADYLLLLEGFANSEGAYSLTTVCGAVGPCGPDRPCLYNLALDPTEHDNVASANPSVVKELQAYERIGLWALLPRFPLLAVYVAM